MLIAVRAALFELRTDEQGGYEYQPGGASEASALRGKYIRYFEDSAVGAPWRLENRHVVLV
ncbi:MAG: hypothetical protein [Olavius algarvensis Delta 4 endosymbiont]|nr:MAG: hypothetical protein [Olavius algarvensis Delta 4 endosymbiont]